MNVNEKEQQQHWKEDNILYDDNQPDDGLSNQQKQQQQSNRQYLEENIQKQIEPELTIDGQKQGKKLKNVKQIESDITIEVQKQLEVFYSSNLPHKMQICCFLESIKSAQIDINSKTNKVAFDRFLKRKLFKEIILNSNNNNNEKKEEQNWQRFNTNIPNMIAINQYNKSNDKNYQEKIEERFTQVKKRWINVLDFKNRKYYKQKENIYLQKLQNFQECLEKYNNPEVNRAKEYFSDRSKYQKYDYLYIARHLMEILKIQTCYNNEISQKIFELLEVIIKMKFDKYTSKQGINFTKQDVIELIGTDVFYKNERENLIKEYSDFKPQKKKKLNP